METLIHQPALNTGTAPVSDDGYVISDIPFTLNINHPGLVNYSLITIGCDPDISTEMDVLSANFAQTSSVLDQLPVIGTGGFLPDPAAAQTCILNAIAELRKDVSIEKTQEAQATIEACLETLKQDTIDSFCNVLTAAVDPFSSSVTLSPDLQFTTKSIEVQVILRDVGGNNLSNSIPEQCQALGELLQGTVTLGEISSFSYDNVLKAFVAEITSKLAGEGTLGLSWNGNIFSTVINREGDLEADTEIEELSLPYTFVGTGAGATDSGIRRDETDIANEG